MIKKVWNELDRFFNKVNKDHIPEYVGEASFFMILSFIPFIMLLFSLLQFTNIDRLSMMNMMNAIVPENMISFFSDIINEVYSKSFGTISISAFIAVWSAGRGFYSLGKGFKSIFKQNEDDEFNKFFVRIESLLFTIIFIISLMLVMFGLVFGDRIIFAIVSKFPIFTSLFEVFINSRIFVSILGLFLLFLYLYKLIANRKMKIKAHMPGAILAAIGWYIVSRFFSIYVNIFTGFTNMYGSLSTVILIMMWVYACITLIFWGAEVNSYLNVKLKRLAQKKKKENID